AHDVGDRRLLLSDRDVDAFDATGLLVDDRVDRQRGLAGLSLADDHLALAAAERNHRVDRFVTGLHGLRDRLAPDHAGRDLFDRRTVLRVQRTLAVDRFAECIDDATEEFAAG